MRLQAARSLAAVLVLASCAAPSRVAPEPLRVDDVRTAAHASDHGVEHGRGTQAVNLFTGAVVDHVRGEGATIGIDYEYRLSHKWGVGGFAEGVTGVDRSFAAGGQLYWHAVRDLILVAGLGGERHHGHWERILRIGGFYEFPLESGWVISPAVFYDFSEATDVVLIGLNVGYIF